jgi:hypothetical protein
VDRKTRLIHPELNDTSFESRGCKPLAPWLAEQHTVFLHKYKFAIKPGTPPLQSTRLLDLVRERIRYVHCSLKTEKAYVYWIRFFIR